MHIGLEELIWTLLDPFGTPNTPISPLSDPQSGGVLAVTGCGIVHSVMVPLVLLYRPEGLGIVANGYLDVSDGQSVVDKSPHLLSRVTLLFAPSIWRSETLISSCGVVPVTPFTSFRAIIAPLRGLHRS